MPSQTADAVRVANRRHSLRRGIMTMTRSAYVQVRCAVVALWSERHQRYAARTRLETSNLTQNSGFAGCSFLGGRTQVVELIGHLHRYDEIEPTASSAARRRTWASTSHAIMASHLSASVTEA